MAGWGCAVGPSRASPPPPPPAAAVRPGCFAPIPAVTGGRCVARLRTGAGWEKKRTGGGGGGLAGRRTGWLSGGCRPPRARARPAPPLSVGARRRGPGSTFPRRGQLSSGGGSASASSPALASVPAAPRPFHGRPLAAAPPPLSSCCFSAAASFSS